METITKSSSKIELLTKPFNVHQRQAADLLKFLAVSVCTQMARFNLTVIHVDEVNMVATDGRTMHRRILEPFGCRYGLNLHFLTRCLNFKCATFDKMHAVILTPGTFQDLYNDGGRLHKTGNLGRRAADKLDRTSPIMLESSDTGAQVILMPQRVSQSGQ